MGRREKRIRSEKEKTVFIRLERGEKGGDLRGLKEEKDTMTNWIKGKIGLIK